MAGRQMKPLPPLYGTPETRRVFMDEHAGRSEATRIVMELCRGLRRLPHEMPRTPRLGLRRECRMPGGPVTINADTDRRAR